MRRARFKAPPSHPEAYYHCVSRVVDRRFILGDVEKAHFYKLMRLYERLLGLQIVSYCLMSNHFHILVEVPARPADEDLMDDEALIAHIERCMGEGAGTALRWELEHFRSQENHAGAEALREKWFRRMWDVSQFMKILKQRFSQWYNGKNSRKGTLWEDRFHSVLVEGKGPALKAMAAYIDLNPVRAKLCQDPKDYRWCGYGEAFAHGQGGKLAQAAVSWLATLDRAICSGDGPRNAVGGAARQKMSATEAMRRWRCFLFGVPETELEQNAEIAREGAGGEAKLFRRRISRKKALQVLASGGRLKKADYLRCRVRYFVDGTAIGSKSFIEEVFQASKEKFHPNREAGARAMRGMEPMPKGERIYNMRQLGRDALS